MFALAGVADRATRLSTAESLISIFAHGFGIQKQPDGLIFDLHSEPIELIKFDRCGSPVNCQVVLITIKSSQAK